MTTSALVFFLIFVAFVLLAGFLIAKGSTQLQGTHVRDLDVYKDQMKGLEKDLARGLVTQGEFETLRAEIGRRILQAAKGTASAGSTAHGLQLWVPMGLLLLAIVTAGFVYPRLGHPNLSDLRLSDRKEMAQNRYDQRPSQAQAESAQTPAPLAQSAPEDAALVADLRAILANRPFDLRGHELLVQTETRLGNLPAAHAAQKRVLELLGSSAGANDWAQYAELMIASTQGYISPQAETALRAALDIEPDHKLARFRLGAMYDQIGRPDRTFQIWAKLLDEGPEAAPYIPTIRASIMDLAAIAGINRYTPPEAQFTAPNAGPSAEEIAEAATLSGADQQAMVQNMVAGLAERLATEGGPATDWAQLITSYGVLGRQENAQAIYNEAITRFGERPQDLQILRAAAERAGLSF